MHCVAGCCSIAVALERNFNSQFPIEDHLLFGSVAFKTQALAGTSGNTSASHTMIHQRDSTQYTIQA